LPWIIEKETATGLFNVSQNPKPKKTINQQQPKQQKGKQLKHTQPNKQINKQRKTDNRENKLKSLVKKP
jgi:hypothetical protein